MDAAVAAIIADVRARGDAAVLDLTARFDRLALTAGPLAFTAAEIDAAIATVSPEDRAALELAADRIRAYHERQRPEDAMLDRRDRGDAWLALDAGVARRAFMCRAARPPIRPRS